jgi:hypothetical protein
MRDKCKQFAMRMIEASLDDHYLKKQEERAKIVYDEMAIASTDDALKADKINGFVAALQGKISGAVYEQQKDETLKLIENELSPMIDELLTEEEAIELYAFISTPTGGKVFRNLDLVRDCVLKGRSMLATSIITAWDDIRVTQMIDEYIRSLGEEPRE